MATEKNFPSNPDAVIHEALNYMQIWVELQKEADKDKMKKMARSLTEWMGRKTPYLGHIGHSSDIMAM